MGTFEDSGDSGDSESCFHDRRGSDEMIHEDCTRRHAEYILTWVGLSDLDTRFPHDDVQFFIYLQTCAYTHAQVQA